MMFDKEEDDFFEEDEETLKEDLSLFESYIQGDQQASFIDSDRMEALVDHYERNQQHNKAVLACNYALDRFPYNAIFTIRKAHALSGLGHLKEALELINHVEHLAVDRLEILLTKASVFSKLHNHKQAIKYLQEALPLSEDVQLRIEILADLASEYQANNDISSCIHILKTLIEIDPKNAEAVYDLSWCYEQLDEFKKSKQCYIDFLDRNPYSYFGWYYLGNLYLKNDEPKKAVDAYLYCLAINETFTLAYFNLGEAYMEQNKIQEAIELFQKCLQSDPQDVVVLCYLGECYEELRDLELAEYYYRQSIALSPTYAEAWVGLGVLEDIRGNFKASIAYFSNADTLRPNDPDILYLLGTVYQKNEEPQLALYSFLQTLTLDSGHEDALIDYVLLCNEYFHPPFIHNRSEVMIFLDEFPKTYGPNTRLGLLKVHQCWLLDKPEEAFLLFRHCMNASIEYAEEIFDINSDPLFVEIFEEFIASFRETNTKK